MKPLPPRTNNLVFAVLSNLTFGAGGLLALIAAGRRYLTPQEGTADSGMLLAFGLIFTGMNAIITFVTLRNARRAGEIATQRAVYPDAPWMWRREWQRGRLEDRSGTGLVVLWAFAVVLIATSIPLLASVPRQVAEGTTAALLLFIFPLAGLGLLVLAIVLSLRRKRFGRSQLVLTTNPLPIGGRFSGQVETSVARDTFAGAKIHATLLCVSRVTGRGNQRQGTRERILWQDTSRIAPSAVTVGPHGAVIPVACAIPPGMPPSSVEDDFSIIIWRLLVDAKIPGADYSAVFEVPAFECKGA
ncbi:MAG TPA: hypothetical protein VF701_18635 [Thermoanaerobaculia bacterium]